MVELSIPNRKVAGSIPVRVIFFLFKMGLILILQEQHSLKR